MRNRRVDNINDKNVIIESIFTAQQNHANQISLILQEGINI